MGTEEDKPLTALTLVQVVKENYFCLRMNLPLTPEILIGADFEGVSGWHQCDDVVSAEPMAFLKKKKEKAKIRDNP